LACRVEILPRPHRRGDRGGDGEQLEDHAATVAGCAPLAVRETGAGVKSYSPERDERVMTLLELALATPVEEREACLHAACGDDQQLLEEILERVGWEERMGAFLLEPVVPRVELDRPFTAGQVILERFEIVREVAEGGMAVVYEAIDRKLDQRIAIKCPKA